MRRHATKLLFVSGRKLFQQSLTSRRQRETHLSPVGGVSGPRSQPRCNEPIHQSYGAVMAQLQSFRELTDGDAIASGKAFDCQQGLMLLRRQACRVGRLFAESEKPTQGITQRRERFVFRFGNFRWFRRHGYKCTPPSKHYWHLKSSCFISQCDILSCPMNFRIGPVRETALSI